MAIPVVRACSSVLLALPEFDELGRDALLGKYGFARAQRYFLWHNERLCDFKAVLGMAL